MMQQLTFPIVAKLQNESFSKIDDFIGWKIEKILNSVSLLHILKPGLQTLSNFFGAAFLKAL